MLKKTFFLFKTKIKGSPSSAIRDPSGVAAKFMKRPEIYKFYVYS